jgi:hypothetical protein
VLEHESLLMSDQYVKISGEGQFHEYYALVTSVKDNGSLTR